MRRLIIILFLTQSLLLGHLYGQDIVNIVYVSDAGITEEIEKATGFILIKRYSDNSFERLDYKLGGPLTLLRSYKDSTLKILHGRYIEYDVAGWIIAKGNYDYNLKEGDWYTYNDTGKIVLIENYLKGTLIKTENPDTVKKDTTTYGDEREAHMKGNKAWTKYLIRRLTETNVAENSINGGTVRVAFRIDTTGRTADLFLQKSVEFILDEESLLVIKESPTWEPAFQNGRKLNAYRIQPLTFKKLE